MIASRNRGFVYRERVGGGDAGRGVVDHLAQRHPHTSRNEWRERVEHGLVRIDGHVATPELRLTAGSVLAWHRPPWEEPEAPESFAVLHEDADVLAVAKPSGLPTLPGAGFLERTLLHLVRGRYPEAAPVHRLGRFTSGVVLFARHAATGRFLSERMVSGSVEKRYRALASGAPREDRFVVEVPIGPVPHALLGTVHAATPDGKPSRSRVVVVARRGDRFLCDVFLETGRPHQIRIHLAAAGHPLVGDPLYPAGGVPAPDCEALPGDPGYLLHAAEITFPHPRSGETIRVSCAPPLALR